MIAITFQRGFRVRH